MLVVVVVAMDLVQHAQDFVTYRQAWVSLTVLYKAHTQMRQHDVEAMADDAVVVAADASVRAYFVGRPMVVVATDHVPVPNTVIKKPIVDESNVLEIGRLRHCPLIYALMHITLNSCFRFTSIDFLFALILCVLCFCMQTTYFILLHISLL